MLLLLFRIINTNVSLRYYHYNPSPNTLCVKNNLIAIPLFPVYGYSRGSIDNILYSIFTNP